MAFRKSAFLAACLAVSYLPSTYAQEDRNGVMSRTPEEAPRAPGGVLSGTVPVGGPWIEFGFGPAGSFAVGCLPADPAGLGCASNPAGNSVFGDAPPWTFTAPEGGATLIVVDAFLLGDQFEIFDFGSAVGRTSIPTGNGDCGIDPDECVADPFNSHGFFLLDPGPHQITIRMQASPFGGGAAYFRVEPSAMDFHTVVPCRVADTRGAVGPHGGPVLTSGQLRSFLIAGQCGIPDGAQAVSLNVTVIGATGPGFLQVFRAGLFAPSTSNVSFGAGQIRSNNGFVALAGGRLSVLPLVEASPGNVHVAIDVTGYFR